MLYSRFRHHGIDKLFIFIETFLANRASAQMGIEPTLLFLREIAAERKGAEPLALVVRVEGP